MAVAAAGAAVAIKRSSAAQRRHASDSSDRWEQARHRILILGGGFGGMATALALERHLPRNAGASVLLVDRGNAQLFVPLLWTVADGRASPGHVAVPIRSFQRGRRFHVLHAEVQGVDLERRVVKTSAGERAYDTVVIALGSITNVPEKVPGALEHSRVFRTPADALELRNRVINALEGAHQTRDLARAAWLTFVIIGGGDTGSELAATISDYVRRAMEQQYPWLVDEAVRVVIVESHDRLVPLSSEAVSRHVRASLERHGITVLTGTGVDRIDEDAVYAGATTIPTRTVFWSAGMEPQPLIRDVAGTHAKNGALVVDEQLRVEGFTDAYAIGDNAWAVDSETKRPVPALAQAAEHQADYVARAIAAGFKGEKLEPFRFKKLGQMTLLGKYDAVAEIGSVTFTGPFAWLAWHVYYASRVGSWRTRTLLITGWLMAALLGRDTCEIPLAVTK